MVKITVDKRVLYSESDEIQAGMETTPRGNSTHHKYGRLFFSNSKPILFCVCV